MTPAPVLSPDRDTAATLAPTAGRPPRRRATPRPDRPAWHLRRVDTPLGPVTLAATDRGLAGLWFDGQKHHPGPLAPHDGPDAPPAWLDDAERQLADWFAGRRTRFDLPLDARGTPFQQAVWRALAALPHGRTCSYAQLAAAAGHPGAVRAVAAAIGRNPVSIVVPCHRVVGGDGGLTGYAGGLDRKRALLALEAAAGTAPR